MNRLLISSALLAILSVPVAQLSAQSLPTLAATPKKSVTITKPASKPAPKIKVEPPTQNIIDKNTIDEAGVRYELTSCKRTEQTLLCRFFLTNKGSKGTAVSIKTSGTRLIDITGEEYLAKEVQIGSSKSDTTADSILISQVPIKASVTFDAPATNVVTLKVVVINHQPGESLKFREIKIAK